MRTRFSLPQVNLETTGHELPNAPLLLVTGGRKPGKSWLKKVAKNRRIWAIDRGLEACDAAKIKPERLIGDGDSADHETWERYEKSGIIVESFPPAKDDTDTQLALKRAVDESAPLLITGAFGGRFDHAFSTLFSCAALPVPVCLADKRETLIFIKNGETLHAMLYQQPKAVSLLPFTSTCEGVRVDDVRWPLNDAVLTQAYPYTISNEVIGSSFTATVQKGILGVYFCWDE